MEKECWLPDIICYDGRREWKDYQDEIYGIFKHDFIDSSPQFENRKVQIRKYPVEYGKEEAFFHVTCREYQNGRNREPDLRRCERIRWVRSFIENYKCDVTECEDCDGIKVWTEPYKNKSRVHLLLEEEKYIVILEPRERYCLLITAFYLDYDNAMEKQLKHYYRYKC